MKFKTKYPEGEWTSEKTLFDARYMIYDGKGNVVSRSGRNSYSEVYTKAILQIPAMRDYMIERANDISSFLKDKWNDDYKTSRSELARILEILRAAGVEVVE